jgi:hypothetical protein
LLLLSLDSKAEHRMAYSPFMLIWGESRLFRSIIESFLSARSGDDRSFGLGCSISRRQSASDSGTKISSESEREDGRGGQVETSVIKGGNESAREEDI